MVFTSVVSSHVDHEPSRDKHTIRPYNQSNDVTVVNNTGFGIKTKIVKVIFVIHNVTRNI